MGEILVLLGELLANAIKQLGLAVATSIGVEYVTGLLKGTAGGSSWVQLSNEVGTIESEVENGSYGLNALASLIAAARTDILTAVALTQQAGSPVTLPTIPPSAYIAPTVVDVVYGVWSQPDSYTGADMLGDLSNLALIAGNKSAFELQYANNGHPFAWIGNLYQSVPWTIPISVPPFFRPTNILGSDDLVTYLNRENATFNFTYDDSNHNTCSSPDPVNFGVTWWCLLNSFQFAQYQGGGSNALTVAPVWPGLAGVTLGTPVALATGVTITEPMDGVLIDITGAPAKQGYFTFDTALSWRNAGAIAFFTDDGQEEYPQTLGFEQAIYTVKTMQRAAGVVLRTTGGFTGTVTPWTVA